ncbi:2344_t:CDS:2 [Entrophospora sp. SA101]|nr:2344_t:CDS:2 [Entrophospora sp. SA101]
MFYNPNNGRYSPVTTATNGKAIPPVAGELFVGKRMVQIVDKEIEWLFPVSENANNKENQSVPSFWKAQSQSQAVLNEESPPDLSTRRTTMFQNAINAVATSSKGKNALT